MGIGIILIAGLGLVAAGCAGANRVSPPAVNATEEQSAPPANEAETVPPAPVFPPVHIEVTQITAIESAIEIIMTPTVPEEPMIAAFGEIHDRCRVDLNDDIRCMSFASTADHMADDIFPFLSLPAYGGIRDHVSEFFRNDPVVDQQLAAFMQGIAFDDLDHLGDFILCPVLRMLESARPTHSQVYGTHLNLVDLPDPAGLPQLNAARGEFVRNRLRDYAYTRIVAVVSQGRSVSFYGGMSHIDPHPSEVFAARSFGDEFLANDNYRAVALIVPEIAEGSESRELLAPALARIPNWRQYIPQEGITFVQTEIDGVRSMYYIFYPRTLNVRELTYDEANNCQPSLSVQ
jgi:hypothetical protein